MRHALRRADPSHSGVVNFEEFKVRSSTFHTLYRYPWPPCPPSRCPCIPSYLTSPPRSAPCLYSPRLYLPPRLSSLLATPNLASTRCLLTHHAPPRPTSTITPTRLSSPRFACPHPARLSPPRPACTHPAPPAPVCSTSWATAWAWRCRPQTPEPSSRPAPRTCGARCVVGGMCYGGTGLDHPYLTPFRPRQGALYTLYAMGGLTWITHISHILPLSLLAKVRCGWYMPWVVWPGSPI